MSMRRNTGRDRRVQAYVPAAGYAADDPRAYGTPVWWHDPDLGLTKDGSNRVSSMLDQSASGADVTNAGAVGTWPTQTTTLNGHAVLRFAATQTLNRALASPLITTDWTIVLVVANQFAATGSTNCNFLRHGHVANNTGLDLTATAGTRTVTSKGVAVRTDGVMTNDTWEVWKLERANGAAPTLTINNGAEALTSPGTTGYNTGANTLDYGISANGCLFAFCCAFNQTGISSAFVTALRTKYGI